MAPSVSNNTAKRTVVQIFVFQGVTFIGQDCFSQERISIGSSAEADLVLEGQGIGDIQAFVYLKDDQIIISDRATNGVRINGTFQKTAMLRSLDLVDIGPYTLKIKVISGDTPESNHIKREPSPYTEQTTVHSNAQAAPQERYTHTKLTPVSSRAASGTTSMQVDTSSLSNAGAEAEDPGDAFADFFQFYPDPTTIKYDLVFYGQLKPSVKPTAAKAALRRLFRAESEQIEGLFQQPRVVVKKNLSYQKAQQLKVIFEKTGAQCQLEPVDDQTLLVDDFESIGVDKKKSNVSANPETPPPIPEKQSFPTPPIQALQPEDLASKLEQGADLNPSTQTRSEHHDSSAQVTATKIVKAGDDAENEMAVAENITRAQESTADHVQQVATGYHAPDENDPFTTVGIYDEDDEDDDDLDAAFQLRDRVLCGAEGLSTGADSQVQIVKLRNDQILDIHYLNKRQRYTIDYKGQKFRLAESRRNAPAWFYFNDQLAGRIESAGEGVISTSRLMRDMKPWRKRKQLFRREMPTDGCVLIHDGDFEYRLSICDVAPPAAVKLPPKEKRHPYKHAATSFVFHIVFIAFLGLFPSFNADDSELESHFVQLDQQELAELEKIINPKPKKPAPPPPPKKIEPPPKPVVQKKIPVTKVKPNKVASKKKSKKPKVASVSRHPKAGGGHGKGNVVNRDVNQAGLLSMLGDSVGFQPQAAVAAVTNLDAVTASGGIAKTNFKVGGIVGKLGTEKISVPTGGIVATKGAKQVLRSIGASGPGKVAALEKGQIGQKQVAGTVTASLTKSVLIQGGMSRQAVKRVIDQHLDEITYCYETALISNPSIMGKMIFEWRILMDGDVGEVRIKSSTVNSHEIHSCIKAAIKTWQFPKPKGSTVVVSYPFIFDVVGF
ncbi:MAG: AgmX/PglI C-terminal domain-containing protein [Desulfosarcinaceae bacterium]|nr:AgmX/PglI C-terminal domain-containing protein [Desulfosarcinaceae bacterium]